MTLSVSATVDVAATPQELLEFVLDLERYMEADHKLTKVVSVTGPDEAGKGSMKVWGRLPGLPPAPEKQDYTLERWSGMRIVGAPRQPGRLMFDFVGTFECEPIDDSATRVTHAYDFTFTKPFKWMERRLADPLAVEVDEELARLAEIFGTGTTP